MSEDKAIFGWFPASVTVKPTVMDVKYFDNDSEVTSPIDTTEVFQVKVRFSKEMNPTVDPTITLDSDGIKDPTVPAGGTWSNVIVSGDAYLTPYFGLSGDHVGTITVGASGGQAADGNVMNENSAADIFTLEAAEGPTLPALYIAEDVVAINHPNVSLRWSSSDHTQVWISGDVQDADNTGQWIPTNVSGDGINIGSGDVVLTSGDGDGLKTVYIKFANASGDETAFVNDYIMLDRSGDAITDVACYIASGDAAIGNSDWTTDDTPYFSWTAPESSGDIRGYAYVLTSGDGSDAELPADINTVQPYVDYVNDPVTPGKHKFIVKAQDEAKNWGSGDQFDFWNASGDSFFMTGQIRAWTANNKVTELTDGEVTASGDGAPYIEWQDPHSPGDDTFYIQISGDNVNENDYAFTTPDANYLFGSTLGVGVTRILVRSITGLGISGDHQEFTLIWASGDIS